MEGDKGHGNLFSRLSSRIKHFGGDEVVEVPVPRGTGRGQKRRVLKILLDGEVGRDSCVP